MLAAGKKFYDALRRVVAEESRVVPSSLFGNSRTARKQSFLILLKCRLNIITMRTKRLSQFSTVIDCEVGALTRKRRHQMRCVAHQGDATYSFPSMLDRKRIDTPYHWLGLVKSMVSIHASGLFNATYVCSVPFA